MDLEIAIIDLDGSYDGRVCVPIDEQLRCARRISRIGEDMKIIAIYPGSGVSVFGSGFISILGSSVEVDSDRPEFVALDSAEYPCPRPFDEVERGLGRG